MVRSRFGGAQVNLDTEIKNIYWNLTSTWVEMCVMGNYYKNVHTNG